MESRAEARLHAQVAAYASWARTRNRTARTEAARRAMYGKFARMVDPDGVLDERELALRVDAARKEHYARLALAAAKARRLRCEQ